MCRFEPPQTISACKAVTSRYVRDGFLADPKKVTIKLYVTWRHAAAEQPKRISTDSRRGNMQLLNYVDEAPEQCEARRTSEKAPRGPIAGTSAVAMSDETLQVDLLFRDDLIALRAMDVFSTCSLPLDPRAS